MQESKVFFFSSRYESFGLAAAEAVACGCIIQDASLDPDLASIKSVKPGTSSPSPGLIAQMILSILSSKTQMSGHA
jgi:hypothetical protein